MNLDNVEDIYTLTPLQAGMLYHTVVAPESGVYVQQLAMTLRGEVDTPSLESAWQTLARRHRALRSVFLWDGLDEPVQVVRQTVQIPFLTEDWRMLSTAEANNRLEKLLVDDRRRGFDLTRAPLFRLRLVRYPRGDWILVWSFHHIILDGWSKEILLRELREVYTALREDRAPNLPEHRPFRDYVDYLRRTSIGSEGLWTRLLGDIEEPTPLGIDRPAAGATTPHVATAETFLPSELTARISDYARAHRVTLNTLVHCAWSILLGIYSGRSSVVYGAAFTNRPAELDGIENTAGLFINTLPVRVDLQAQYPLDQWMQDLQDMLVEIRSNAATSLPETKRFSRIPTDQPLFESLLVFENYTMEVSPARPEGLNIANVRYLEQSNFPLALLFVPGEQLWVLSVFDTSRFTEETIKRLLVHLGTILDKISSGSATALGDISVLADEEASRIEGPTCNFSQRFGFPPLVHDRILEVAEADPDRIAVQARGEQLTYRELEQRSRAVTAHIAAQGLGEGSSICLLLDRSLEMIVAILGVLRAGAAYVPIDPTSPARRIHDTIEDCKARLLITSSHHRDRVETKDLGIVLIDQLDSTDEKIPCREMNPETAAYILYTSGSSGTPKGVEVSHGNLAHSTYARFDYYDAPPDSFLLLSSYSFDSSVAGIFWTLCSGGTLVISEERLEQDIEALARLVHDRRITHTLCLPSLYRLILEYADPQLLSSLRTVIVAGEQCPTNIMRRHFEVLPDTGLYNEYGPTEATVWATVDRYDGPDTEATIGRPIAGVSVYVCGDNLKPVPVGVEGEILLGGPGVTRGYLNRPDLTARSFVTGVDGSTSRLYRTGDLGRIRPDGRLEFLGRIDTQIKIRGHRVEPEEIEQVLVNHSLVSEAAVVAVGRRRDSDVRESTHDLMLRAFVTTVDGTNSDSTVEDLTDYVKERVPPYMVPGQFIVVPKLARTSTGKIDRRALETYAEMEPEREDLIDSKPSNEVERVLQDIWQRVLRIDTVGLSENFFALGGDSILSIEMTSLARRAGLRLNPQDVFAAPSIRGLAATVVSSEATITAPRRQQGPGPLLPIHQWFFELQGGLLAHWNMSRLFELPAEIDEGGLRRIVDTILRQHPELRLRIENSEGEWRASITQLSAVDLIEIIDLTHVSPGKELEAIEGHASAVHQRIHPETGHSTTLTLCLTKGSRPNLLLVVAHHAVVDIVSWLILQSDLETLCRALASGKDMELTSPSLSMVMWAQELKNRVDAGDFDDEIEFWTRQGIGPLHVPIELNGECSNLHRDTRVVARTLDYDIELLRELAIGADIRLHELVLAAVASALAEWMTSDELLVGIESHGRQVDADSYIDLSRTVGWLTASYPLLLSVMQGKSILDRFASIRDQVRRVPRNGLGYGALRYLSGDADTRQRLETTSRPDILYNFGGGHWQAVSSGSVKSVDFTNRYDRSPESRRPAVIEVNATTGNGRLELEFHHSEQLHRQATMEQVLEKTCSLLLQFASECSSRRSGAGTLDAAQLSQDDYEALMRSLDRRSQGEGKY